MQLRHTELPNHPSGTAQHSHAHCSSKNTIVSASDSTTWCSTLPFLVYDLDHLISCTSSKAHVCYVFLIHIFVCAYLWMDACIYIYIYHIHVYPVSDLEREIPHCIDQRQWFFVFIRQAKGLKSKAWNPYQPPPALSFRNKLVSNIFYPSFCLML